VRADEAAAASAASAWQVRRAQLRGFRAAVNYVVKPSLSAIVRTLIALMLMAGVVFADPPQNQKRNPQQQNDEQLVFVTGSLIPRRVKLNPIATKTQSPVRIIDRREIDQTGRFTTPGAFVNEPAVRIIGH
jgi:hypothetical protein